MYPPSPWIGSTRIRGDIIGGQNFPEDFLLDVAHHGLAVAFAWVAVQEGMVGIGKWRMHDPVHQREKAFMVVVLAGGKSDRAHGAAVEAAQEADKLACGRYDSGLI